MLILRYVTELPALVRLSPKEELPMSAEIKYIPMLVTIVSLRVQC